MSSFAGTVEMVTAQSSPTIAASSYEKKKKQLLVSKSSTSTNNSRTQLIASLTKTGLPLNFLKRLLQDFDDSQRKDAAACSYRRISDIDEIECIPPNSSYINNICSGLSCNTGFLVEKGCLGRGRIDENFVWFAPGFHKINDFGCEFNGIVRTNVMNEPQVNGSTGFVTISEGNVGVLIVGCEYKLLCPGCWSWNSTPIPIKYHGTVDITQKLAKLGPFCLVTCPEATCSVSYHNGTLKILGWGGDDGSNEEILVANDPTNNENDDDDSSNTVSMGNRVFSSSNHNNQVTSLKNLESQMYHCDSLHLIGNNTNNASFGLAPDDHQQEKRQLLGSIQQQQPNAAAAANSSSPATREPSANASTNASFDEKRIPAKLQEELLTVMQQQQQQQQQQVNHAADEQPQHYQTFFTASSTRTFFLDDPKWIHDNFLSLKMQTDILGGGYDNNSIGLLTKDNIYIALKVMSQWRIKNPDLAVRACAKTMEKIRKKVNELVYATMARIVASTTISQGAETGGLFVSNTITKQEDIPVSSTATTNNTKNPLNRVDDDNDNDDDNKDGGDSPQKKNDNEEKKTEQEKSDEFFLPPTPLSGKQGTASRSQDGLSNKERIRMELESPSSSASSPNNKKANESKKKTETIAPAASSSSAAAPPDLSNLMQSTEALFHMRELSKTVARMGIEILGVFVPERRMVNDDIRVEVAKQALIGIRSEAERAAADSRAYADVKNAIARAEAQCELARSDAFKIETLAKAEAQAIRHVTEAFAKSGEKLGDPNGTAARLAMSQIVAKAFKQAEVTLFSGEMPSAATGAPRIMK